MRRGIEQGVRKYGIYILVGLVFWLRGVIVLDPDFGWHYRFGELVATSGIPRTDPFSFTMPSFEYVNHEWFTDLATYYGYSLVGIYGLSAFYVLAVLVTYFVSVGGLGGGWRLERGLLFLQFAAALIHYFGTRPQVISWVFLAAVLHVLYNEALWKRWKKFLPLYFMLWANLHGGFLAGLVAFGLVLCTRAIVSRRINVSGFALFLLSVVATFINPYGIGLWREVWSSVSDWSLHSRIGEWAFFLFAANIFVSGLLAVSGVFVWYFRSKIRVEKIVVYFFFLFQGIVSVRNIPLWVVSAIPLTVDGFVLLGAQMKRTRMLKARYDHAIKVLFIISLSVYLLASGLVLRSSVGLSEGKFYPVGAVEYLKAKNITGNVFTGYNWGGYMIWRHPEAKVFVDGRMPSWENRNALPGESVSAMDDYFGILQGRIGLAEQFDKFNIWVVVWSTEPNTNRASKSERIVLKKLLGEEAVTPDIDLLRTLQELGWEEYYRDDTAVVMRRI